jgi:hypothetical protein
MITQWQNAETIVGRLCVGGAKVDPAIAQLRLPMLLNNALTHPNSLPPSAIVFIRKLSDPLPRSLRLQHSHVRPPAAWQQALDAKLQNLVASAARPALGPVPANAEAVVFLDLSELLASLANDWCENRVATHWWWQSLLRRATAEQIVKEFWQDAPQYVPAAFDKLARIAKAATFVKTFSDSEARTLLISVGRTFALNDLLPVVDHLSVARILPTLDQEKPNASPRAAKHSTIEVRSKAPWDGWIQINQISELRPEQERLLGVAVMLQRAPERVRTANFAREVETWWDEIITAAATPIAQSHQEEKRIEGLTQARTKSVLSIAPHNSNASTQIKSEVSSFAESLRCPTPNTFGHNPSVPQRTGTIHQTVDGLEPESLCKQQLEVSPQSEPPLTAKPQFEASVPESGDKNSNVATSQFTTDPPSIELQTETDFGGLFYLINLGIYLGLYGDFTTPAEPGIELNIWDFVALVGRELIGERVEDDPVWALLQGLAGRAEGEDPGSPQVRVWLDELMPNICARLRSALGLNETEDPGPAICEQHALVTMTPTHIDLFFALDDLPIELRIAGLDRDPGWVPAAGRFIKFHFD